VKDNIHEGHRKRLKQEFLIGGFNEDTPAHKWLELLLFYCIPQVDTNELAHKLIDTYGSLGGVLEAPFEELLQFPRLTENNIPLLKMIIPIARQCALEKSEELLKISKPDNIGHFIISKYYGLTKERFSVTLISQSGKITDFKFLSEGDISEVGISMRNLIQYVIQKNCFCVVVAHNHPNGLALPSKADIDATIKLRDALSAVNVKLLDHLIISGKDYVSLAQSKDYYDIFA